MKQHAAFHAVPVSAVIPACLQQADWKQATEVLEPRLKRAPKPPIAAR